MKVVQALGWYYPDSLGGTEIYVAGLSRRLRRAGHDVLVAAPDPGRAGERTYEHDGVPVFRYPIPSAPTRDECQDLTPVRGTERLHAWLERQRPDVVHVHTFVTGLGFAELRAAKAVGARVIVTTHASSLGYICQRGTMMRWGEGLCDGLCEPMKCAACVLHGNGLPKPLAWTLAAVPPAIGRVAGQVSGKLGTALGMSGLIARNQNRQRDMLDNVDVLVLLTQWALDAVIANGAPPHRVALNRLGVAHEDVRRKASPDERPSRPPITVGYLGRFDPIKGVADLARAVVALPPDVALRAEFRGPANSNGDLQVLETLHRIVGADPRVTFAPPVPEDQVLGLLAQHDVLCCPAVCLEGGPTVAIEAQAAGTPVIGTRIGGLAELVTDGVNGRLVQPGDWRALAAVLRDVACDPGGTIDRWRRALPAARTMDAVTADYLRMYAA